MVKKTNNHIDNLEWSNDSLNMIHAYKNKLWIPNRIQSHSVVVSVYDLHGNLLHENVTSSEAARLVGGSKSSIARAIKSYNGLYASKSVVIKKYICS